MKRNGYMVIALIGILLAVTAIGFGVFSLVQGAKKFIPSEMSSEVKSGDLAKVTVIEIESQVSALKVKGIWDGSIQFDDTIAKPVLELTLPKDVDPQLAWKISDGTLLLDTPREWYGGRFVLKIKPISVVDIDMAGDIELKDIKTAALELKLQGLGSLKSNSGSLEKLHLVGKWLGDISFEDLDIKQIDIDLEITGKIDFGSVDTASGSIKGLGSLNFDEINNRSSLSMQGIFDE